MDHIEKSLDEKYAHLLTVCKPINDKAEIDVAILNALLKAEKENSKKEPKNESSLGPAIAQLSLALQWNRVDVAKNFIFADEQLKDKVKF